MRGPRVRVQDLPPELREAARAARQEEAAELRRRFVAHCRAKGLPEPVPEHRFHPTRKWRMDFAWLAERVYLEMQGGVWTEGYHTRGSGFVIGMEKNNEAALLGWRLLQVQPVDLFTDETMRLIEGVLDFTPTT
jgi:hypothetical protein